MFMRWSARVATPTVAGEVKIMRAGHLARAASVVVLAFLGVAAANHEPLAVVPENESTLTAPSASELDEASCIQRSECCKVCSKGQACGNTCISRSKNCHKGRGCACDAEEICE